MTIQDRNIFFALIRAAIWMNESGKPTDERLAEVISLVPIGYDWAPVIKAFEEHAMLGVVAHVIMSLPHNIRPQLPLSDKILSHVAQIVRQRYKMQLALVDVFSTLEKSGIKAILLKGEGLAALFPKNTHRSVGDIDVLVSHAQYEQSIRVLQKLTNDIGHDDFLDRHYKVDYGEITIEIHHHPGWGANGAYEKPYQKLSLQYLVPDRCDTLDINGGSILTPCVQYNAFYVFNHLMHHFRDGGVGFRQFIDWYLLLHHLLDNINKDKLKDDLQTCGLLRPWQILGGILVKNLGLPEDEFPFYDENLAKKSQDKILNFITDCGNFGFFLPLKNSTHHSALDRIFRNLYSSVKKSIFLWTLFPSGAVSFFQEQIRNTVRNHLGISDELRFEHS